MCGLIWLTYFKPALYGSIRTQKKKKSIKPHTDLHCLFLLQVRLFTTVAMFQDIACFFGNSQVKEDRALWGYFREQYFMFLWRKTHRLLNKPVLACVNGCTSGNVSTSFSGISFYSCSATWKCES